MLPRITPTVISELQFNPNLRIALFLSILSFPLSLFATEPSGFENADGTIVSQAPKASLLSVPETVEIEQGATDSVPVTASRELDAVDAAISAPETVEIEQGAADTVPVTVSRELDAVDAAITVTESGLDLQKATSYKNALIPAADSGDHQPQREQVQSISDFGGTGADQRYDSLSESKSTDAGDFNLAHTGAIVSGEVVGSTGGVAVQEDRQSRKVHLTVAGHGVENAETLHLRVPDAVILALIAVIGLVSISRRRVTHM